MGISKLSLESRGKAFIDDVIEPRNTREYINKCLDLLRGSDGKGFMSKKHLQSWPTVI